MSARLDGLRALQEAVKADTVRKMDFVNAGIHPSAFEAAIGSLDAAHALHKAVLPGWLFCISDNSAFVTKPDGPMIVPLDWDGDMGQYHADADNPARAWLLAILAALIAGAEARAGKGEG